MGVEIMSSFTEFVLSGYNGSEAEDTLVLCMISRWVDGHLVCCLDKKTEWKEVDIDTGGQSREDGIIGDGCGKNGVMNY